MNEKEISLGMVSLLSSNQLNNLANVFKLQCMEGGPLSSVLGRLSGDVDVDAGDSAGAGFGAAPGIMNLAQADWNAKCRVCERLYDGSQHFGVEICRACAAFFRRAVEGRKEFICRRGGNSCPLDSPRKVSCQRCRYMQCLRIGIRPDQVPPRRGGSEGKRDPKDEAPDEPHEQQPSSHGSVSVPSSPHYDEKPCPITRPIPINIPSYVQQPFLQSENPRLIYKIVRNYKTFCDTRLLVEMTVPGSGHGLINANGRELSMVCISRLSVLFESSLPYLVNFIRDTFERINEYSNESMLKVVQMFALSLWELEFCFWTYRTLQKDNDRANKWMTTMSTYLDLDHLDYFLQSDGSPATDFDQLNNLIRSTMQNYKQTTLRSMHRLILSEVEFAALVALTLWSPRIHAGSSQTEQVAEEVRSQIYDELHYLYKEEMKMDNYAKRLGEVMVVFTDLQMNAVRAQEIAHVMHMNDMFKGSHFLLHYLMSSSANSL